MVVRQGGEKGGETYAEAGASFGSGEAYGGRGGSEIEAEATILVPIREHTCNGERQIRGEGEVWGLGYCGEVARWINER